MFKLKAVVLLSVCTLVSSLTLPADVNPLIDSAYARGDGGGHGGGNGGGHGGGHGGAAGGHGAGMGAGHGLAGSGHGFGHDVGHGLGNDNNDHHGLGQGQSKGHGAVTSAVARSDETSGLAKAMAVVATTPAAIAAALGLGKGAPGNPHDPADDDDLD
ncbi:hypothetical protein A9179_12280 [Pseudomonas alcaligenes]|uniref:Uncharacterized protein n=1 Tax=Aquipseudomonas alcaligenes TaxID=43263 RepID=A0ABR7S3T5_AQUAC|nr:hypothetical protein [Pseudomonas alcaligenes]MBC9251053.1 hypothetical protein [Pseudomonas alcaligenes]